MLINKLNQNVKTQLFSRHFLTAILSCFLLVVCGLLSEPALSAQQNAQKTSMQTSRIKKDPTRPPSVMAQQLAPELAIKPEYELTAIFTRSNNQYAVVNGNVVKAGDPIADMLVTEISASNLTMKHANTSRHNALKDILVLELSGTVNIKKQVKQ